MAPDDSLCDQTAPKLKTLFENKGPKPSCVRILKFGLKEEGNQQFFTDKDDFSTICV